MRATCAATAAPRAVAVDLIRRLGSLGDPGDFGLGLWRFTTPSLDEARALVEASLDAGVRLLDNADVYGANWGGAGRGACEEMLGRIFAVAPPLRERCILVSKGGIVPGVPYDQRPEVLRAACEASLRRMRVERIDLYLIHRPDLYAHPAESAAVLAALREEGKVAEVGVSNFSPAQHEALARWLPFPLAAVQPEYSPAHLGPMRDGTLDLCMRDGVVPLAWSPLAGGRLLSGEGMRPELLAVLDEIAAREGVGRADVCYAFVRSHPARPVVLLGTQRPERVRAAAACRLARLERPDLYRIVQASEGARLP